MIDGLGALTSALMLGLVLPMFQEHIGIPTPALRVLAAIALLLAIYSLSCYRKNASARWLGPIAIANVIYCMITFAVMLAFQHELTRIGMIYFIGEMAIILTLAFVEKRTSGS